MSEELKTIQAATEAALVKMQGLVAAQDAQIKSNGEVSAKTAAAIDALDKTLQQIEADKKGLADRLSAVEAKGNRMGFGGQDGVTIGKAFTDSQEFKTYRGGNSERFYAKDISNAGGSAQVLPTPYRTDVAMNPNRPIFVADLLRKVPVNTDAVQIVRELAFTNNAAPQAGQLATKATSNITYSQEVVNVQTIAHSIIASRQILDDAPRLQALIDGRLQYGVQLAYDAQLLYGTGTANDFKGMLVDANVQNIGTYAAPVAPETASSKKIDHFRKALTALQNFNFYNATGAIISPSDWEAIELAKGTDGHYMWVNVNNGGEQRLWRVSVVLSGALTNNDFLVGDFSQAATLYTREGFSVRMSESHADLFLKNGIAILGEDRAAFGIELPKGLCKGKFAQT